MTKRFRFVRMTFANSMMPQVAHFNLTKHMNSVKFTLITMSDQNRNGIARGQVFKRTKLLCQELSIKSNQCTRDIPMKNNLSRNRFCFLFCFWYRFEKLLQEYYFTFATARDVKMKSNKIDKGNRKMIPTSRVSCLSASQVNIFILKFQIITELLRFFRLRSRFSHVFEEK